LFIVLFLNFWDYYYGFFIAFPSFKSEGYYAPKRVIKRNLFGKTAAKVFFSQTKKNLDKKFFFRVPIGRKTV